MTRINYNNILNNYRRDNMTDELNSSVMLEFKLTDKFFRDMNRPYAFDIDYMNGTENSDEYTLILFSSIPADIKSCLNDNGQLLEAYPPQLIEAPCDPNTATIHLLCQDTENNHGFNISVAEINGVSIQLGNEANNIQGAFIINTNTRYLIAYCRLTEPLKIKDSLIIPFVSSLVQVGNCK